MLGSDRLEALIVKQSWKLGRGSVSAGREKILVSFKRGASQGHHDMVAFEQNPEGGEEVPWETVARGPM